MIDFLAARVWQLRQDQNSPDLVLEFASDSGTLLTEKGSDIRELIRCAYAQTDFWTRRA